MNTNYSITYRFRNSRFHLIYCNACVLPYNFKVIFSDSGASAELSFNTATYEGTEAINNVGSATSFKCSKLFSFSGAADTTCSWVSNRKVLIVFGNDPSSRYLQVNEPVTLLQGIVVDYIDLNINRLQICHRLICLPFLWLRDDQRSVYVYHLSEEEKAGDEWRLVC